MVASMDDQDNTASRGRRTTEIGIVFATKAKGECAERWVFGVPVVFLAALDIRLTSRVNRYTRKPEQVWTRGEPPLFSFAAGDVFYEPGHARELVWSEAVAVMSRHVQILEATTDARGPERNTDGQVRFRVDFYAKGRKTGESVHTLTQSQFAEFLRTGELPSATFPDRLL